MKRLFFLSLSFILLFSSCRTSTPDFLYRAAESEDIDERIEIYQNEAASSLDLRAYYNLAYLHIYNEAYDEAEKVLKEAILYYPASFRLYTALEYVYQQEGDEEKEIDLLYEMIKISFADEEVRTRLLNLLFDLRDERAYSLALETIEYFPENQAAINVLSLYHPFFRTRSDYTATIRDIARYKAPLFNHVLAPYINPSNYEMSFLESNAGTLLSQSE